MIYQFRLFKSAGMSASAARSAQGSAVNSPGTLFAFSLRMNSKSSTESPSPDDLSGSCRASLQPYDQTVFIYNMKQVILVIDQGTSATKAFVYDAELNVVHSHKIRHAIHRPKPGWAESDPQEIADSCRRLIDEMMTFCREQSLQVEAIGMAVQRSTFLFWDKETVEPLTPAMSWQDSRASEILDRFRKQTALIESKTGMPLSAYFGGPKFAFTVEHNPEIKRRVDAGTAFFGPLSAYLTHSLTGTPSVDESIAGRSLLFNLESGMWDEELLNIFGISDTTLPPLKPTCGSFGEVSDCGAPLLCVIGDQQASLIGHGHQESGDVAMNFGTSGSVQVNSGENLTIVPSLLTNVLNSTESHRSFMLEGTINSVGSLFRWLEGHLGISHEDMKWDSRCHGTTSGVLVPGMNGIAAPHWTGEFEPILSALDDASPDEIVRAGMESIGFLVNDICEVIQTDGDINIRHITISGGSGRPPLVQFIADLLGQSLYTSADRDMSGLGTARMVVSQAWPEKIQERETAIEVEYNPIMSSADRDVKITAWRDALRQCGTI